MSSATDQVQHVAHGLRAMADSLRSPADLQRLSEELKQLISSAKSQEDAIEQVQAGTEQATNTTSSSPQPAQQRKAKKQRVGRQRQGPYLTKAINAIKTRLTSMDARLQSRSSSSATTASDTSRWRSYTSAGSTMGSHGSPPQRIPSRATSFALSGSKS
jgi:hypothetical protein